MVSDWNSGQGRQDVDQGIPRYLKISTLVLILVKSLLLSYDSYYCHNSLQNMYKILDMQSEPYMEIWPIFSTETTPYKK